jgi:2Fe-2S ferredoxin
MPKIVFIELDGNRKEVTATSGTPLMNIAIENDINGILGECGGNAACATCHVYVDENYLGLLPAPEPAEEQMLEATSSERLPNSRLSCQILLTEELDGIVVTCPMTQN